MKRLATALVAVTMTFGLVACSKTTTPATTEAPTTATESEVETTTAAETTVEAATTATSAEAETTSEATSEEAEATKNTAAAPAPDAEEAPGFTEIPIGEKDVAPLHIGGVYFQPVDMEPAGNSLPKKDADCHMEADISALAGNTLGYEEGTFVPYLQVKCFLQKEGSKHIQEIAFMPMNASDGPHYGANVKFEEGLGVYKVRFEVSAPGNEYLLHVDKETGVDGRFWTEPIVAEWSMDWAGPKW